MIAALLLPQPLRDQIEREACAAVPRECCGLIEGVREGDVARAVALHPMRNLASEADSFEIDPAGHCRLQRSLRGTGRAIVGCYHSHPDGRAVPSDRDLAGDGDFIWLIAAADAWGLRDLAAHLPHRDGWRRLALPVSVPAFEVAPRRFAAA
jgi:proteasome lid subunit RPN8/RPN11